MQTSTELELNQLLEELSEIKADEEDVFLEDNDAPPPPPRDSLVFDSPLDVAVRNSQRISVNNGKISYYEEPKSRNSDRFSNSGNERFSTRNQNVESQRSSDRFGDSGNERFSTRTSNQVQSNNNDRFSDRGNEEDRFSTSSNDRFSNSSNDRFSTSNDNSNQFSEVQEYEQPKSTKCGHCSKDISGDALQALGQLFHVDCFSCNKCSKKIGTEEFYVKDNKAYCEHCYKSSFLPKCSRCRKEIEGKYLKALNQDFHEKCFNCSVCNAPFSDGKFYEKDDNAYCHQHYNQLFGFTCAKCHQTITDGTAISALDKYWHRNHFTCTKCSKPFSDEKFFEDEGLPYCQEHYHERRGTICGKCNKIIDGLCVSALDKKWHQNCFTCTNCNGVLSGQVMLSEGKVYCPKCADKL